MNKQYAYVNEVGLNISNNDTWSGRKPTRLSTGLFLWYDGLTEVYVPVQFPELHFLLTLFAD